MSKNIKLNDTNYNGVSTVQLPTTDGGTATFKDTDEITTPSGNKTITENGTYDVTNYAQAIVSVEASSGVENPIHFNQYGICYAETMNIDVPEGTQAPYMVNIYMNAEEMKTVNTGNLIFGSNGTNWFNGCSSLTEAIVPHITNVPEGMFSNCNKLNKLVLGSVGNPVASVSNQALKYVSSSIDFGKCDVTIYVDASSIEEVPTAIKDTYPWGGGQHIVTYRSSTTGEVLS